ncbi:MAG: hypothetical protein DMD82_13670 [Candidatus Rokuibacteriota bacterium]|nr:MAG: hypothetical protein DMD82_13670 [Candidatus Rokubacteria bacterium]
MSKIAFLGLGQMGTPMATRLLQARHHVTVWNRTAERAVALVERGAVAASSPAEAAAGADLIITMLATPEALEQVMFGAGGLALGPGQTLIEMSTIGPKLSTRWLPGCRTASLSSTPPSEAVSRRRPMAGCISSSEQPAMTSIGFGRF